MQCIQCVYIYIYIYIYIYARKLRGECRRSNELSHTDFLRKSRPRTRGFGIQTCILGREPSLGAKSLVVMQGKDKVSQPSTKQVKKKQIRSHNEPQKQNNDHATQGCASSAFDILTQGEPIFSTLQIIKEFHKDHTTHGRPLRIINTIDSKEN